MTDTQIRRLEEKLDKLIDTTADLRVMTSVMHEHIKAVDDDQDKAEKRITALEKKVWPAVGAVAVLTPIGGAILALLLGG